MPKMTKYPHGTFCWVELVTEDTAGAKAFYNSLFGWEYRDDEVAPGMIYTMNLKGGKPLHAMYALDDERKKMGVPPHWLSYASVDKLEPVVEKVKSGGGQVLAGPMDVFDVGRMAAFTDPQGAAFAVWQPKQHIGAELVNEHGALTWNELMTNNVDAAGKFYTDVFGWKAESADMGGFVYTSFSVGERPNAGMMAITKEMGPVPPNWMPYFACDNCDGTAKKAKSLGAQVVAGPQDIPEVGRFATAIDPQGAAFSFIQLANPPA